MSPLDFSLAPAPHPGREAVVQDLLAALDQNHRFLAITGAPGCGKTSLIQAALATPRAGKIWRVAVMQPGQCAEDLVGGLGQALLDCLPELRAQPTAAAMADLLTAHPLPLELLLNNGLELIAEPGETTLWLVIDPLEAIFFDSVWHEQREQWLTGLTNVLAHPRVRVLAALRADFLPRCADYPRLHALLENAFPVPAPTAAEWRKILLDPLATAGLRLEPASLAQRILQDAEALGGNLVLARFAMGEFCRQRRSNTLNEAEYQAIGGLANALDQRMQALYDGLREDTAAAWPEVAAALSQFPHGDDRCLPLRPPRRRLRRDKAWQTVAEALENAGMLLRDPADDRDYLPYEVLVAMTHAPVDDTVAAAPEPMPASPRVALPRPTRWLWPALAAILLAGVVFTTERWHRAEQLLAVSQHAQPAPAPSETPRPPPSEETLRPPIPKRPGLAADLETLGDAARDHPVEALVLYRQALKLRLAEGEKGATTVMQAELAATYRALGQLYDKLNLHSDAANARAQAAKHWDRLLGENPDQPTWLHDAALNLGQWASVQQALGESEQALQTLGQAIDHAKHLTNIAPDTAHQRLLAHFYDRQGDALQTQSTRRAKTAYQKALDIRLALSRRLGTQQARQEVLYSDYKLRSLQ